MEIRRATPDVWQLSRDIRLRSLDQDPNAFCSSLEQARSYSPETWKTRLDEADTVLAWVDDRVVATATGKADPHEDGGREVVAMWVDPAHRRSGAATAMLDELVRRAREAGAASVALWVADDNDKAKRLYETYGFEPTGEREAMRPGVDQVRMRLTIT